jgi:hypothetical protein
MENPTTLPTIASPRPHASQTHTIRAGNQALIPVRSRGSDTINNPSRSPPHPTYTLLYTLPPKSDRGRDLNGVGSVFRLIKTYVRARYGTETPVSGGGNLILYIARYT